MVLSRMWSTKGRFLPGANLWVKAHRVVGASYLCVPGSVWHSANCGLLPGKAGQKPRENFASTTWLFNILQKRKQTPILRMLWCGVLQTRTQIPVNTVVWFIWGPRPISYLCWSGVDYQSFLILANSTGPLLQFRINLLVQGNLYLLYLNA